MADLELKARMRTLHGELVNELARAQTSIEYRASGFLSFVSGVDESVLNAWRGGLNTAGQVIAKLADDGSVTLAVLRYERTYDQWLSQAKLARDQISAVLNEMGSNLRWGRLWDEVAVPTGQTIKAGAESAGSTAARLTPWVAAAIIALVVGYAIFTVRRVVA